MTSLSQDAAVIRQMVEAALAKARLELDKPASTVRLSVLKKTHQAFINNGGSADDSFIEAIVAEITAEEENSKHAIKNRAEADLVVSQYTAILALLAGKTVATPPAAVEASKPVVVAVPPVAEASKPAVVEVKENPIGRPMSPEAVQKIAEVVQWAIATYGCVDRPMISLLVGPSVGLDVKNVVDYQLELLLKGKKIARRQQGTYEVGKVKIGAADLDSQRFPVQVDGKDIRSVVKIPVGYTLTEEFVRHWISLILSRKTITASTAKIEICGDMVKLFNAKKEELRRPTDYVPAPVVGGALDVNDPAYVRRVIAWALRRDHHTLAELREFLPKTTNEVFGKTIAALEVDKAAYYSPSDKKWMRAAGIEKEPFAALSALPIFFAGVRRGTVSMPCGVPVTETTLKIVLRAYEWVKDNGFDLRGSKFEISDTIIRIN